MNIQWRQNIPLIVGLAIPVVMVIAIFVTIYIPRLLVQPQTNFVYVIGAYPVYEDYTKNPPQRHTYQITENKLQEVVTPLNTEEREVYDPYYSKQMSPTFYLYHVKKQESEELTLEQVQKLRLDKNDTSPDGFRLEPGGRGGSIFDLFGSSSNYPDMFLVGHNASFKLNLKNISSDQYYGYDAGSDFVGWIK